MNIKKNCKEIHKMCAHMYGHDASKKNGESHDV